ncbi:MAG: hypothetical protein KDA22_06840 [Phycisphaerales bacterium]|nr:hypothetical protein [Phycisphaerales bacterium]
MNGDRTDPVRGDRPSAPPTEDDARTSLRDHLLAKAAAARAAHGPAIDSATVQRLLADRSVVRYPTELVFDAARLRPGEFAFAEPRGSHPRDGFRLAVHPYFERRPEDWPLLVAYHIPPINYGDVATSEDCECFGAALVGLDREAYYRRLCALADAMASR